MISARHSRSRRRRSGTRRIFGWVVFFLLVAGVATLVYVRQWPPSVPTGVEPSGITSTTTSPEILLAEERYRRAVQDLFAGWDPLTKADFSAIHQQLLEITVPKRYQTLHLDLVIAFNALQRGQASSDQASVEEGLEKLDKIFASSPWIRQADEPAVSST